MEDDEGALGGEYSHSLQRVVILATIKQSPNAEIGLCVPWGVPGANSANVQIKVDSSNTIHSHICQRTQ